MMERMAKKERYYLDIDFTFDVKDEAEAKATAKMVMKGLREVERKLERVESTQKIYFF